MKNNKFLRICLLVLIGGCHLFFTTNAAAGYKYVRVDDGELWVDFNRDKGYQSFLVKGIGYAPHPVGTFPSEFGTCRYMNGVSDQPPYLCKGNLYDDRAVLERDFPYLKKLGVNTIRTWGEVTRPLLEIAHKNGIKVIAGFWIRHDLDFTKKKVRRKVLRDFNRYVRRFRNHPALLMWGLSNENDMHFCSCCKGFCSEEIQARAFYDLVNQMAKKARSIEGRSYHPVMVVSSSIEKIGRRRLNADDESLNYIDIHGINAFKGKQFGTEHSNLFTQYQKRSKKPLLITEFGFDAWYVLDRNNPKNGELREDLQAEYLAAAWDTLHSNTVEYYGPAIGGVAFVYSDFWWGHEGSWDPSCAVQDYGYAPNWSGGQPDGFVNEEWWGIMSIAPNPNRSKPDIVKPREAYYRLKEIFKNLPN